MTLRRPLVSCVLLLLFCLVMPAAAADKPRVFVLTDIENEPDDAQSLVRFLTYSNQFDVEGLVATTSVHMRDRTAAWRIREIVEAYGKVRGNLLLHEPGWPTVESLLSVVKEGRPAVGMRAVGAGHDSAGSEALVAAVDRDDPRPVWVTVWGGPNVLAQALWHVQHTRTPEALAHFVSKLRVYTISDQDDSGPWIRKTFPSLFYIVSPGSNAGGAYHFATWSGISGDKFHGRFAGGDFALVDNPWLDENVRRKGPLGAQHPRTTYLMEGDTPSFLGLIDNGLNTPEHPEYGGWGGRYELYTPRMQKWYLEPETRPIWTDAVDEVRGIDGNWHTDNHATIWRWRAAYQHDFAARMDWTIKPYAEANHPPVVKLGHPAVLTARPGERVALSAEGSSDPDGQALSYEWFYYAEPGSFATSSARSGVFVEIKGFDQPQASFTVPTTRVMLPAAGTMHIILAVTDHGTPRLTRYQRVIVNVVQPVRWGAEMLRQEPIWYSSPDARAMADSVLLYQSPEGAWPKNTDLSIPPRAPQDVPHLDNDRGNTIDNGATTTPMQLLARVGQATGERRYQEAFERGLRYLLSAQYANGGWPQFFPLRQGYYSHITFNDDAMTNVLQVLRDVSAGGAPYTFVDAGLRARAAEAVRRGIAVMLRTQIRHNGRLAGWCAQYDEKTLAPAWARNYEPPSLSGSETVGIVRFLMQIERPSAGVVAAVEGAVAWLESVALHGQRVEHVTNAEGKPDRRVVADPAAGRLWARFYDLKTNRPIFIGRDRVIRSDFAAIEWERRTGYAYHGTWPESLLSVDYPRWRAARRR